MAAAPLLLCLLDYHGISSFLARLTSWLSLETMLVLNLLTMFILSQFGSIKEKRHYVIVLIPELALVGLTHGLALVNDVTDKRKGKSGSKNLLG
ncbi:Uncharacterized protein TCM_042159 [Theobroma cacao]|uniref:Uncharacterized protein n=1 Tax=Theobroma cacao TaxID=3641 RepID=A0A061H0B5_THECC|nr:Uncharacterized protein TCM_042159 [Theobroma cacao]